MVFRDKTVLILCFVLASLVFVADLNMPLGVAGGVPYIAVIFVSLSLRTRKTVFFFAILTSVLTSAGLFFSPDGGELWKVLSNRFLALFAIWLTTIIGLQRNKAEQELQKKAMIDELTQLYNRRGFSVVANERLKLAQRAKENLFLFFADMDGLKAINDSFGHDEGDNALMKMTGILKQTFRESDIISRFAGDEFAILAANVKQDDEEIFKARLGKSLERYNAGRDKPYSLSVSMGSSYLDIEKDGVLSIRDLMTRADEKLYELKNMKTLKAVKRSR